MNTQRIVRLFPAVLVGVLPLVSCSTMTPADRTAADRTTAATPSMAQVREAAVFYRHLLLSKGQNVRILQRGFTYTLVQLPDGEKGYVESRSLAAVQEAPVAATPQPSAPSRHPKPAKEVPEPSSADQPQLPPSFRY